MTSCAAMVVRLLVVFLFVALPTGCVMNQFAGEGPLRLSAEVSELYGIYSIRTKPLYFLVTDDGQCAAYSYCTDLDRNCRKITVSKEFEPCESDCGAPCKTLARHGKIVWKGPVTHADGKLLNP